MNIPKLINIVRVINAVSHAILIVYDTVADNDDDDE